MLASLSRQFFPKLVVAKLDRRLGTAIDRYAHVDAIDADLLGLHVDARGNQMRLEWMHGVARPAVGLCDRRAALCQRPDNLRALQQPQQTTDWPTAPDFIGVEIAPPAAPIGGVGVGQLLIVRSARV